MYDSDIGRLLRGRVMLIVVLGYVGTRQGEVSEAGVPLRASIVIDSLFTKNMHNEFKIARPICRVVSYSIETRSHNQ